MGCVSSKSQTASLAPGPAPDLPSSAFTSSMPDHIQRANLDGRDDALQAPSSTVPLIIISLASDPDNNAVTMMRATFGLDARSFTIQRRTSTNDGRTMWANIPAEYWATVVREGDEIRALAASPALVAVATKPQWEVTRVMAVYGDDFRPLLLCNTYKATKRRLFELMRLNFPFSFTPADIGFSFKDVDGETLFEVLDQPQSVPDDDWQALLIRFYKDQYNPMISVFLLQLNSYIPEITLAATEVEGEVNKKHQWRQVVREGGGAIRH
ncbi:hypothetical protein D9619_012468 [Psilocybe cf. subviscida]|uniref:Uncharacterized protein n=1 Tax=Psilocybe cf. subviscida TaxID=2480587 RepID=A0A8H5ERD8_9AGAR|nr:hypothetical protein D9619_012468 [Psilocybe cf. subviscida]